MQSGRSLIRVKPLNSAKPKGLTLIEGLQILVQLLRIARCLWTVIGAGQMSRTLFLRSVDVALRRTSAQDPALSAHHRVLLTTITVQVEKGNNIECNNSSK